MSVNLNDQYEVIGVEMLNDGIIVMFGNGKCGVYSGEALYAKMLEEKKTADEGS